MAMIELRSVVKRYNSQLALSSVSLVVEEGAFFALLGPNGAGKTTIIRVLLDFTRPDSGFAAINDTPCSDPACRSIIGYLPETVRIPSWMCCRSFLWRSAAMGGLCGSEREREIDRCTELASAREALKKPAGACSKGMIQRIGLAAALMGRPRLLILDEPTGGLDPIGIRDLRTVLENLKTDRVTLLLNSHVLSEVEKLCDAAAIIHRGNIVASGPLSEIVPEGETLEDVFVRSVTSGKTA